MSPEMVENRAYNHTLDVWCLGILLYELLHGHAPFTGQFSVIKEKILRGKIRFRKNLPKDCRNLILNLLQREPNERIPLIQVFNHEWILRMQEKHNLSNDPPMEKRNSGKLREEEKGVDSPSKKLPAKVQKFLESPPKEHFKKPHEDYKDDVEFEEFKQGKRAKDRKKEPDFSGVSPNDLEKELRKIEKSEAQKRKLLEEQSLRKKFDKKKRHEQQVQDPNKNLLDLSGFENKAVKPAFNPKFEKLQKIESKNAALGDRESTLPKGDDFDDMFDNTPQRKRKEQESPREEESRSKTPRK
jgi:serine/threonine protein kinase